MYIKKSAITFIIAACMLPIAALAGKVELSGQVSRAITYADNGVATDVFSVDNNNSGTRFRLKASNDVGNGIKGGIYWETQYQVNSSSGRDIDDADQGNNIGDPDGTSSTATSRIRELWFSGGFGKVSLGKGNGAANGTSEIDYSGTFLADYATANNLLGGGIHFREADNTDAGSKGSVFSSFDGASRNDRLRYDAPATGPVKLAGSVGQDLYELALRFAGKMGGGGKYGGGVGYVDRTGSSTQTNLSVSFLLASGTSFTGSWAEQSPDASTATNVDKSNIYFKVGQQFGNKKQHAASVSYQITEDRPTAGNEATSIMFAYLYNMAKGVQLFAALGTAELDRTAGAAVEDLTTAHVGSRIKF